MWYLIVSIPDLCSLTYLGCCPFQGSGSVVVDSLLIVIPIVGFSNCSIICCALVYVHSSFAIILIGKRKLVALLSLTS